MSVALRGGVIAGGIPSAQITEPDACEPAGADEALYRFTDRLFRAPSLHDVCDAALDAIAEALGCERASILTFDDSGVMRFVS